MAGRPILVALDFEEASLRAFAAAQTLAAGLGAPIVLTRVLLGSVAEQVVRRASVPVLPVRVPG